jgi:glycosyltransferase involved in cell wall biosynthesis
MVVADNQWTLDWPDVVPVVGFMHGVADEKAHALGKRSARAMARRQALAGQRPNTLWVACAEWVGRRFGELYGNAADFVIRYPVDLERFGVVSAERRPELVLHDARTEHKGRDVIARLARRFPELAFEPLACAPEEMPERMAEAAAFVLISRYEGNSVVVNEALATDLPCFLTDVGLMRDDNRPEDVWVISAERAFRDIDHVAEEFGAFLESLPTRSYHPRAWVEENVSFEATLDLWRQVTKAWKPLQAATRAATPGPAALGTARPAGLLRSLVGKLRP